MKRLLSNFSAEQIKYVWRNIGRKKKQTIFTVLCILVSSFIIMGNLAMNNGIRYRLKEGINEAVSGQLTVYAGDSAGLNILESQLKEQRKFAWSGEDTEKLEKFAEGITVNRRIRFGSLVSYGEETSYIFLHAVEQPHLERINRLLTLKDGTLPTKENEILISETTAKDLHCGLRDTLLLVAENTYQYMSDEIAVVSGIFEEKGLALYLNYTGFIPYGLGESIVRLEDDSCLELIINSAYHSDISSGREKEIGTYLQEYGGKLRVASWDKTVPLFFTIVNVWKGGGRLTQMIFVLFSLIILINLTTLIIQSRKKEFGTLLAIGFSWGKITRMVSFEYLIITCSSLAVGYLLLSGLIIMLPAGGFAIPSKDMQAALMTDAIPFIFYPQDLAYVFCLFVTTVMMAVLISISHIKKLTPVELIRNLK